MTDLLCDQEGVAIYQDHIVIAGSAMEEYDRCLNATLMLIKTKQSKLLFQTGVIVVFRTYVQQGRNPSRCSQGQGHTRYAGAN